jgi:hypothetical protein
MAHPNQVPPACDCELISRFASQIWAASSCSPVRCPFRCQDGGVVRTLGTVLVTSNLWSVSSASSPRASLGLSIWDICNLLRRLEGRRHSAFRIRLVEVLAARRPGMAATRLARSSAPSATSTAARTGTLGSGRAKSS